MSWPVTHLLIVALVAGTLGQVLSGLFRMPSIVFLLAFGVALGPDGLALVDPRRDLGPGLEVLVRIGVALILFEGGMSLRLPEIRKVQKSVRRLVTLGVLFTFVTATAVAHYLGQLPFRHACLFGALVTVTGPTVIRPLVQRIRMRPEIAAILEGEGILADPVGAILAAVCLEYALSSTDTTLSHLGEYGLRVGAGLGIGVAVGALTALIVRFRAPSVERIKPLVVIACGLGGYGVAEMVRHEAGIMAVVAAGLAVQMGIKPHDRELREIREFVATSFLSVLFILLAANLRLDAILAEARAVNGLMVVLAVMLAIRPLNILLCTTGGAATGREKVFLSWVAPRGIVAASVASLGALILEKEGDPAGRRVEALVFMTVFLTVFLQGGTAKFVAHVLGITVREPRRILVVGANAIARHVARRFSEAGRQVTVIDRNPVLLGEAQRDGLRAVSGDATDRAVLHQAGLDEADVLLAFTPSTAVNQAAAQVALHDRDLESVGVAIDEADNRALDPILERHGAEVLFGRPLPLGLWQRRLVAGAARFQDLALTDRNAPKKAVGACAFLPGVVPVLLRRGDRLDVVRSSTRLLPGDVLTILTDLPEVGALEGAPA